MFSAVCRPKRKGSLAHRLTAAAFPKKGALADAPATGGGLVDAGARVLTFAARLVRRRLVVSIDRREMVDAGRAAEHSIDCAKSVFASVDRSPQWSRSTLNGRSGVLQS